MASLKTCRLLLFLHQSDLSLTSFPILLFLSVCVNGCSSSLALVMLFTEVNLLCVGQFYPLSSANYTKVRNKRGRLARKGVDWHSAFGQLREMDALYSTGELTNDTNSTAGGGTKDTRSLLSCLSPLSVHMKA